MTRPTDTELADLRAKAEAALKLSPGKDRWEFSSKGPSDALGLEGIFAVGKDGSKSIVVCNTGRESGDLIEEDGEFIAAANPAMILDLLDDRDRLIEEIARLREEVAELRAGPKCQLCGKPANCYGQYSGEKQGYACDECCGHGNEDGWCEPLPQPPEAS